MKNFLSAIRRLFRASADELDDYWYTPIGVRTKVGLDVNESSALTYTAVYACVRAISETIASLPLHVYRRLDGGGKERATDHPLYYLLHTQPNPDMTSVQYREAAHSHILLWGNHYSEIQRDRMDKIIALWPLDPSKMTVERNEADRLQYRYRIDSTGDRIYSPSQILHIAGLGFNGLIGYSPVAKARESIGMGLALEEFGERFFSNNAVLTGALEHPQKLSPQAHENLSKSFTEKHVGLSNAFRPMILEEGMKWHEMSIPLEDAQFLEMRKFQVIEVCRIFNVPPYKIADFDRATWGNVEQQAIDWVVNTIRPWLVKWEQAMAVKLFPLQGRGKYFAEHLIDGLLRGDIVQRYTAYQMERQNGIINADEWRERENMNPQPEGKGKLYYINSAMIEVGTKPENTGGGGNQPPDEGGDMSIEEKKELEDLRKKTSMMAEEIQGFKVEIASLMGIIDQEKVKFAKDREEFRESLSRKDALINKLTEDRGASETKLNARIVDLEKQVNSLSAKLSVKDAKVQEMTASFSRLYTDAIQRIIRREQIFIKQAVAKKDLEGFESHIEDSYRKLPEFISSTLHPCVATFAEFQGSTGALNYISGYIPKHIEESRREIKKWNGVYIHGTNGELKRNEQAIDDCLNLWIKQRPEKAVEDFKIFFESA